jgi:hypothetical protein
MLQFTAIVLICAASAVNPLIPDIGMADPHVHVFDSQFLMVSDRSEKHPD